MCKEISNKVLLKELIRHGGNPNKLKNISTNKQLRSCLCVQIVSQGECKLTEIVKQVRLNGY